MIAALYVETDGCYFGVEGVDPWDLERDARSYRGPHRVVAHPPCKRWGRYWSEGPSAKVRRLRGDDEGCFAHSLWSVRTFGGVIEHPEASSAWLYFVGPKPADLIWGPSEGIRLDAGFHSKEERAMATTQERCVERLGAKQRLATPTEFRDLLIDLVQIEGKREGKPGSET